MSSISIIIPSFNSENTILETLESVVNQTSSKWECVIVDDYSEDKTIELVNEFIKKNSRFKLVQKTNEVKGANSSRNLGVQFSKNHYISFIDSDDVLDENFVFNRLKEVDNLNQPEVVFFTNYSRFKDDISKSISITNYKDYDTTISIVNDYLLMQEPLPFIISSGVWKRDMFKDEPVFNENYKRLQDVEMIIRFLLKEPSFKIISNNPDYYYRYEIDSNIIKKKRFLYIKSSVMLYKDLILNFNTIESFKRRELLKNLKRFANKSLKTIYLSKQFDYVFFKKTLEEFKQSNSDISFKSWSFFSFLKKIRISDMPIINNVLFRIIR